MKAIESTIFLSCLLAILSVLFLNFTHISPSIAQATAEETLPRAESLETLAITTVTRTASTTEASSTALATDGASGKETETPSSPSNVPAVARTKSSSVPSAARTTSTPKPRTTTTPVAQPPKPSSSFTLSTVASQIHSRTNAARANKGLSKLTYDATLASLAQTRSADMSKNNYFSHTSPNGCDLTCHFSSLNYVASAFGENLAEYTEFHEFTDSELAAEFIGMWLNSPGHRANLMSSNFTREGIGIATKGDRVVVTVVFAQK